MPIKIGDAFGETAKQKFKREEEVGQITAALAGVASGIIKIPEKLVSLGAELIDLGFDTNTAASVEKFFDDLNPFDELAEARTIGKITEAITQIAPVAVVGAARGASEAIKFRSRVLARKAIDAKQNGKYFSSSSFAKKFLKDEKFAKTTGGVVGAGVGETLVADEDLGTFADALRGTSLEPFAVTMMDKETKEGREEAFRRLKNRVKFGIEGSLFNVGLIGIGKGIQGLRNVPEEGLTEYSRYGEIESTNTSLGKIFQKYLRFGFSPQGTGTLGTFNLKQKALNDLTAVEYLAKRDVERFDKTLKEVFPSIRDSYFIGSKKIPSAEAEKKFLNEIQEILQPTKGTPFSIINKAKRDLRFVPIDPVSGKRATPQRIKELREQGSGPYRKLINPVDQPLFKADEGSYLITKDGKLDKLLKKVKDAGGDHVALKNSILQFRSTVDNLSANILTRGLPEELSKELQRKIGGYLTTEYKLFTRLNPLDKYKPTQEVRELAKEVLRKQVAEKKRKEAIKNLQDRGASFEEVNNFKFSPDDLNNIKKEVNERYNRFVNAKSLDEIEDVVVDGKKVTTKEQLVGKPTGKEVIKEEVDAISIKPGILKDKVLEPWQEMLAGKITDPRYTFITTVGKQANLLSTLRYMDGIDKIGSKGPGKFIFTEEELIKQGVDVDNLDPFQFKKVKDIGKSIASEGLSPLEGKIIRAPIYDAIFETSNNLLNNNLGGILYKYTLLGPKALTQISKTVLSAGTHVRNFTSAAAFALANGAAFPNYGDIDVLFKGKGVLPAKKLTLGRVLNTKEFDEAIEQLYAKGLRRGIFQTQTQIGEFKRVFRDFAELTPAQADANTTRGLFNVMDRVKKIYGKVQDAYVAEDDFWKAISFNLERNRFEQVLSGAKVDKNNFRSVLASDSNIGKFLQRSVAIDYDQVAKTFNGTFDDFLDEISANIVRNNVPNYSYIGRAGKALRLSPFGNFIAFPLEIIRTGNNIIEQGIKEISSGIPALEKLGHKRLISFGATIGAIPFAVREVGKSLNNVTEDEMEALKRYVPEWSKNSTLVPVGRDEKGYLRYIDFSYSNAYDTLIRPIQAVYNAIAQGQRSEESLLAASGKGMLTGTKELLRPFTEESIFTQALAESVFGNGIGRDGVRIYSPEDDTFVKIRKSIAHLAEPLMPTTLTQLKNLSTAITGQSDDYGRSFSIFDEVSGIFGFKPRPIDPERGLVFKTSKLNRVLRQDRALFTAPLLRGGRVSPNDIIENYRYSEARRFYNLKEAFKDISAARDLGVPDSVIEEELSSRPGLKRQVIKDLMDGVFTPQEPTKFFIDRTAEINEELNRKEGRFIPNPYDQAEPTIFKIIEKNDGISLGDEDISLTDIGSPRASFNFSTPREIQTPPLGSTPAPDPDIIQTQTPLTSEQTIDRIRAFGGR